MSRRRESLRDSEGRTYLHPEWSGDLAELDPDELHHRVEEIGAYIGRVTTEYLPSEGGWRERPGWHELVAPAVQARLDALRAVVSLLGDEDES